MSGLTNLTNPKPVSLRGSVRPATADLVLWVLIKRSTDDLSFKNYQDFIDFVLCGGDIPTFLPQTQAEALKTPVMTELESIEKKRRLPYIDSDSYRLLKAATEAYVMVQCAVKVDVNFSDPQLTADIAKALEKAEASGTVEELTKNYNDVKLQNTYLQEVDGHPILPYLAVITRKLPELKGVLPILRLFPDAAMAQTADDCYGLLLDKLTKPCMLELIWSYWLEQGMLVQTMNAISRRMQNIRGPADADPLAMMELDYLRPLNNMLWGYIQDEQHRLSVARRAYEYDHHYGLKLEGKAVPELRTADSRSGFLESFHNLLYTTSVFFRQDDDNTVTPDGFPVLNALRHVHMLLSEGAHNQYGDLPSTARVEMMMQQWLLARPEFREVLPARVMVAYPEAWMDRVDAMKRLQNWTDTSVLQFHRLAELGEQILLSIRWGNWSEVEEANDAAIWARFWRSQIQGYIHAYSAVTGVNLAATLEESVQRELRGAQPSMLMRRRMAGEQIVPAGGAIAISSAAPGFRERQAARRVNGR